MASRDREPGASRQARGQTGEHVWPVSRTRRCSRACSRACRWRPSWAPRSASCRSRLMQGVTQPFQQLTQPLQQVSSMFGQMGDGRRQGRSGRDVRRPPFSNHPAIGGTGASAGAGLVRAASLPGAGGTSARTPLMANLVGRPCSPRCAGVGGAVPRRVPAPRGLAPVGAGMRCGGGPMGMVGQRAKSGGTKPG